MGRPLLMIIIIDHNSNFHGITTWYNQWLAALGVFKCYLPSHKGSMYAIYGNIYHQYTPFMLAVYHTGILWVRLQPVISSVFGVFKCYLPSPIGSMYMLYMVTWIPSIYPLYVSIFLPAPWIHRGHGIVISNTWTIPGNPISVESVIVSARIIQCGAPVRARVQY